MVLHLRLHLHGHLMTLSNAKTSNTLECRSSKGEGAKKRSKARTKKLVQQERAKKSLDKDAFSLTCSSTSHVKVRNMIRK